MDADFYARYKGYSNVELLQITRRPQDYQPAAVSAASTILQERNLLPEELATAESDLINYQKKDTFLADKVNVYREKFADVFEPILHPRPEFKPEKWLVLLLIAFGIEFVWTFFSFVHRQVIYLRCQHCRWDGQMTVDFLQIIYVSIIFYLLLKTRRWGWILLFADSMVSVLFRLGQIYFLFRFYGVFRMDINTFIISLVIKTAFVVFLWRKKISDLFHVSGNTKRQTAWAAIGIGAVSLLLLITLS